jgi:hypothetical protein
MIMSKKEEGSFEYDGVQFDYRVYITEGYRGNNYDIAPRQTEIDIDFIGFFPDTNLVHCLHDSVEFKLMELLLEDVWI